jgi:hypothetical protein
MRQIKTANKDGFAEHPTSNTSKTITKYKIPTDTTIH